MKIGKLAEPILIRSVLKQIGHRREEVLVGPGVGLDCAAIALEEDEVFVMSSDPITGTTKEIGAHSVHITVNDLAAGGSRPIGLMLTVLLPPRVREQKLREMMQDIEKTCRQLNIEVVGGHTEVTNAVNQPIITVTGIGKIKREDLLSKKKVEANQDILVTKWIGMEATAILAREKEEELRKRFPLDFIERAKSLSEHLSVLAEASLAKEYKVTAMHDITEGGIFGALWELGAMAGVGLTVDIRRIPILQETVEICEYFNLNPYQIMSSGSMLMVTEDGAGLAEALEKKNIAAQIIGRTTDSNDKILKNKGEDRFLDRPQADELYKIMG